MGIFRNRSPREDPKDVKLQIDISGVDKVNEKQKARHKHFKNQTSPAIGRSTPAIPEDEEKIASKWKIYRSKTQNIVKRKVHLRKKDNDNYLNVKRIPLNNSSSSSSSESTYPTDTTSESSDGGDNDTESEEEEKKMSDSDGESDAYYDSETELEYSVGTEGPRKLALLRKKSSLSAYGSEGIGNGDDFFEATAAPGGHSPFQLANSDKNVFTPDALSPYGINHKYKRSRTVCAKDMVSKHNKKGSKKNKIDMEISDKLILFFELIIL